MKPKVIAEYQVPILIQAQRLSNYCIDKFDVLPSRKSVKKAIQAGRILLNGAIAKTGDWVESNALIQLLAEDKPSDKVYEMVLPIIFEDEHLAIINKPAGVIVSGNQFRNITNMLPYNITPSKEPDALARAVPVHRLDAPTSGLLVIAKTALAQLYLGQLFAKRAIQKTYQAIVCGSTAERGVIAFEVDQKAATSHFQKLKEIPSIKNAYLSWLSLQPTSGRTHQLRKHLAGIGHPIMGDELYGQTGKVYKGKGLFLCAVALEFQHPITNELLNIQIDPPNKFSLLMEREYRMWERKSRGKKGLP